MKSSARGIAGFLRGDRSLQAELRMRRQSFSTTIRRRDAEVHVLMPLRDAERNALVELIFGETLGRGVHYADQLVVVAVFLIEQGRGMFGIETKSCFHPISVVREVVHLLRNVGKENLIAIGQRGVIVEIFF